MTEESPEPRTRLRTIVVFSLLFAIFAAVVLFGYWTTFSRPMTTVIVVRHAEKNLDPNNQNPDFTAVGQARAQELARACEFREHDDLRYSVRAYTADGTTFGECLTCSDRAGRRERYWRVDQTNR